MATGAWARDVPRGTSDRASKRLAWDAEVGVGGGMDYFLGVDAGGTKTRAVLSDGTGAVCGTGEAGAGNWQAVGAAAAGIAIRAAVTQALARGGLAPPGAGAKLRPSHVRGAFFGLAGVRTGAERATMGAELASLGLGDVWEIGSDLDVAHAAALGGRPGVVIIAGTGSAAFGRNASGETAQAGGWGWLVDDAGGAYWLALRGLAAICEAADGRGPSTCLTERAEVFFDAPDVRTLLRGLHGGNRDRAGVAGFAREIRLAASAGDAAAVQVMQAGVTELVRMAVAVRDRLSGTKNLCDKLPLAVTGGLGLGHAIAGPAAAVGFAPVEPWGEPVLGAILLAARRGGVELDAAARTRLITSWKTRA